MDEEGYVPVKSYAEAIERGFKPLDEIDPDLRAKLHAAKAKAMNDLSGSPVSDCGPGHDPNEPCKDFCYSTGVREICYCSPAGQCDDRCVYGTCTPY